MPADLEIPNICVQTNTQQTNQYLKYCAILDYFNLFCELEFWAQKIHINCIIYATLSGISKLLDKVLL